METVIALGLIAICFSSVLGPRLNVAAPLILVVVGAAVGFLPGVPLIHIEPELVLEVLLPPLLYATAVSMPVMDFRREFSPIAGLSVVLVILSSVALGFLLWWLIPDLDIAWAIALGAVLSPTDAVATSIVKSTGVSPRIVAILEGEGLLNDATALVMLRTSIAAAAASFSVMGVAGLVLYSVAIAAIIGFAVGKLNLWVRSKITNTVATTTLSLAVPFVAMIPAEELGASGLVAAVVAGLVTGQGAAKHFSPQQRTSDYQTWQTVEFVLEGIVFLTMGLQFHTLIDDLPDHTASVVAQAAGIAGIALVGSVLVRAIFVAPLLGVLHRRSVRRSRMKPRLERFQEVLSGDHVEAIFEEVRETGEVPDHIGTEEQRAQIEARLADPQVRRRWYRRTRRGRMSLAELRSKLSRTLADIDYFVSSPLTWRDGTVVVWAGMRGAITVAAAQTMPLDAPQRSYLVLIAFFVAGFSLLIQGGTLRRFVAIVKPTPGPTEEQIQADAQELSRLLDSAAEEYLSQSKPNDDTELGAIVARRDELLRVRDEHTFDAALLSSALESLDVEQLLVEMRRAKPF